MYVILILSLLNICKSDNVKKSVTEPDEYITESNEDKNESSESSAEVNQISLKHCSRRQNSRVHEIRDAVIGEFPFMAAIFSRQDEYLCSGTVVTNGLIVTAARCIDRSPAYVMLNTIRDRKDNVTAVLHITDTEKFSTHTDETEVGLLHTEKLNSSITTRLKLSTITENQENSEFEAFGYGLNADSLKEKRLQYVGLETRLLQESPLVKGFIDCVEIKVPTCFRDFGGPALVNDEMYGIVVKGETECTKEISKEFSVSKLVATVLPVYTFKNWLDDRISKYEIVENSRRYLKFYPEKPLAQNMDATPKPKASAGIMSICNYSIIITSLFIFTCLM